MPASLDLEAAVAALDPIMALMAVIQMTGDRTLLDRYWNHAHHLILSKRNLR